MPLLTPRFVGLFNEAYEQVLVDENGNVLTGVPMGTETRPDIVAEFAFRGSQLLHKRNRDPLSLLDDPDIVAEASRRAFEVVRRYEGTPPVENHPLSQTELDEGYALVRNYVSLYRAFPANAHTEFCPQFQGSGFLSAAEGDLGIEDTLIEIKTTTRKVSGKDLRQLITYLALDSAAGTMRWSHIGIFNPRRGTLHRAQIDALLLRVSGGKPRVDVLAELVSFAQTTDLVVDRTF
ncbi:hypothetical protein [Cupriavidus sp. UGS-1]|uniref:hypothetical protein n=1 Tax=Cupriavidus sp. UGS-1 TaxID=2899826 RepID=UPI001E62E32F|nr:hypothetical protein [Cupriavidus sp. UGS-1]MCD9122399.1 hypothetical protein [Cupriavidus sp. UGS-1]